MKFKVGDKVKIVDDCPDTYFSGRHGRISDVDADDPDMPYEVEIGDSRDWFQEDEVEERP